MDSTMFWTVISAWFQPVCPALMTPASATCEFEVSRVSKTYRRRQVGKRGVDDQLGAR